MSKNPAANKNGKSVIYTLITFVVLVALFLSLVSFLYTDAESRAMETLHVQTKQIKDDLTLQMLSDRENLATMANFAAKWYVLFFYVLNFVMVSTDLVLYIRNVRLDRESA